MFWVEKCFFLLDNFMNTITMYVYIVYTYCTK